MPESGSVVLSTLEFDVLWERERLPARHVALDVLSPGKTHSERARLVREALDELGRRGLAEGGRATPELADWLNLLAFPQLSIDSWVWTDHEIKSLAVSAGGVGLLAVVEPAEVWLIPARDTAVAEAAVSVAGVMPAGRGYSVSVDTDLLLAADGKARGRPQELAVILREHGVSTMDAKALAAMLSGMGVRGQFCVERRQRDQHMRRADRVVAFHDNPDGRYAYLTRPNNAGKTWSTITPADNAMLVGFVRELCEEV
ncbi:MAG TPA: ESX secretion-associated protein EspG [Actinophytocola sp.]|uniref:ESX secretion-associated protein EspG n=1 Tax=Actinophytocola sp. TaxID=1872138 RepID=UPI002DBE0857|nr:ESX secretion-associated protein EspG [Actinophytocola sp.]HEU5474042.1 ESX secretion-associated protein EspG [Actinophytocola sp.]